MSKKKQQYGLDYIGRSVVAGDTVCVVRGAYLRTGKVLRPAGKKSFWVVLPEENTTPFLRFDRSKRVVLVHRDKVALSLVPPDLVAFEMACTEALREYCESRDQYWERYPDQRIYTRFYKE